MMASAANGAPVCGQGMNVDRYNFFIICAAGMSTESTNSTTRCGSADLFNHCLFATDITVRE